MFIIVIKLGPCSVVYKVSSFVGNSVFSGHQLSTSLLIQTFYWKMSNIILYYILAKVPGVARGKKNLKKKFDFFSL